MSSWADPHIERLAKGHTVKFRPKGNSMSPKINSGDLVTVAPARNYGKLWKNCKVLCKVKGRIYLHLVSAIRENSDGSYSYQISNNKGHTNGWASQIYGVVTHVVPRRVIKKKAP